MAPFYTSKAMLITALLLVSGCEHCTKAASLNNTQEALVADKTSLGVDPETIFSQVDQFTYRSELIFRIGQGDTQKTSREIIEAIGSKPNLWLKKSTEDNKSLQIFRHGEEFLVKDHNGPFHRSPNKILYQELLRDGLNAVSWIIKQFDLGKYLTGNNLKQNSDKIYIKNAEIPKDSLFIKNLASRSSQFSSIEGSKAQGSVSIDSKTGLPKAADLDIEVVSADGHFVSVRLTMAMNNTVKEILVVPEINEETPVMAPVNIGPRFNQMMELEQGVK
jgi:hypothetical protein